MTCQALSGRKEVCLDSISGIHAVYLADFGLKTFFDNVETITDIKNSSLGIPTFYKYEIQDNTTSTDQTEEVNKEIGMSRIQQEIVVRFKQINTETNFEIKNILSRNLQVVVHDKTGAAWFYGKDNGMRVTSGKNEYGSHKGGFYGYDLIITGEEQQFANYLTGSTIDDPFAGMETDPIIIPGSNLAVNVYCFISNEYYTDYDGHLLPEGYGYINNNYFYMSGDDLVCNADNAANFYVNEQTGQLVELI